MDTISKLIFTKEHNSVNITRGVIIIVFCTSSDHGLHLYQVCLKYLERFKSYASGHDFNTITNGLIQILHVERQFLFFAHRLIMVYICTKFGKNILNGLRGMDRTICDGQTHRRTDIYGKNNMSYPKEGET